MTTKIEKKILGLVIIAMAIVLIVLCAVLVRGFHRASQGIPPSSFVSFLSARRLRGPLPLTDANLIRPWMTFDYIDQLFGLPKEYLKAALGVSDSRYPNLSLSEYQESLATSSASFLSAVKSAVLDAPAAQQ